MSLLVRPSSKAALKAFAEQLGPLPAARAFGHREVQKVFEAIKKCSDNIFYDRIRIMGGDEQKTSCWATLDFDCVAFVNVDEQFWDPINLEQRIDDLEKRVVRSWELNLAKNLPEITVEFPNGCKWAKLEWNNYSLTADIVVGVNTITESDRIENSASGEKKRADLQSERVMRAVSNFGKSEADQNKILKKEIISVSVMERSSYLMTQKPALNTEVARLAKFWALINKAVKMKGLSSLISIIASDCNSNLTLLEAFTKFLGKIAKWKDLSIDHSLDIRGIPKLHQKPKVVDPGNIFDNYLKAKSGSNTLAVFKKRSLKTKKQLSTISENSDWASIADCFLLDRYPRLDKRLFKTVIFEIKISNNHALFPQVRVGKKGRKHRFIAQVFLLMKIAASFVPRLNCDGSPRDTALIAKDLKMLLTTRLNATFVSSISSQQKKNKTHMSFELPVASEESSLAIEGFV
ncbi:uncharacterized protein LOC134845870 [Symsagittifera roscoffensis]|uniref:uncharacterized protein LOC134845870 n=1 Tax=Symsagittifera roscoffensis TaxID=84072 RepID=UPI00307CBBC8